MFQGHSVCSLDAKSRLVLPSKFRKYIKTEANNKLILTRGMDECILVYPQDEWEKVEAVLSNYNVFNAEQRFFIRQFIKFVNECELDSANRILLPSQLIDFAHIKKEVVVLGMLDKIEIWDPDTMKAYDDKRYGTYEDIAQKVSETILNKKFDIQNT